jgi:hypothetical protein
MTADRLRQAAQTLRDGARAVAALGVDSSTVDADAAWDVLVGAGFASADVALAVADWLDATSHLDDESTEPYADLIRDRAIGVADLILGGAS